MWTLLEAAARANCSISSPTLERARRRRKLQRMPHHRTAKQTVLHADVAAFEVQGSHRGSRLVQQDTVLIIVA